jgi:hypothetical protein
MDAVAALLRSWGPDGSVSMKLYVRRRSTSPPNPTQPTMCERWVIIIFVDHRRNLEHARANAKWERLEECWLTCALSVSLANTPLVDQTHSLERAAAEEGRGLWW